MQAHLASHRSASVRPASRSRTGVHTRQPLVCKSVQFDEQFMAQLQESLQRQETKVGDDIGVPITLKQQMAGVTEATGGCNTGTMVWSAGLRLARHLVKNRSDVIRGARILELGSGTGVVGITCAALGGHVILTDQESILQGTFDNVQANQSVIDEAGGSAQVAPFDWTDPTEEVFEIPYDWVLGADVTYEIDLMPSLAAVMCRLVDANPEAVVKIAHRHRSKELDKAMREIFGAFGLVLRPVDVRTTGTDEYDDPIRVDESIIFFRIFKQPE